MLRCLIVTGDKPVRDTIQVGLQQLQQCDVVTSEGRWALDDLRNETVDVVIADARLGDGSDGAEFLSEVRALQPEARLVLVAHGKAGGRMSERERNDLGLAGVIRVPITAADFFRTVARIFGELGVGVGAGG